MDFDQLWRPERKLARPSFNFIRNMRATALGLSNMASGKGHNVSVVQAVAAAFTGTPATSTVNITTSAGHLLFLTYVAYSSTAGGTFSGPSGVADTSGSNSWTVTGLGTNTASPHYMEIGMAFTTTPNPAAVTSVTATWDTTGGLVLPSNGVLTVFEISGANNTSPVDTRMSNVGASTSPTSNATAALANFGEVVLGVLGVLTPGDSLSSLSFTQGAPSTALPSATTFTGTTGANNNASYLKMNSKTAQALTATITSDFWVAACIAIAAA